MININLKKTKPNSLTRFWSLQLFAYLHEWIDASFSDNGNVLHCFRDSGFGVRFKFDID